MPSHAPTRWTRQQRAREAAERNGTWRPATRPSRLPGWIPAPLRTLIRVGVKGGVLLLLFLLATALFYSCLAFRYDLSAVASMPERSLILDREGRELATLHGENRRLIEREEIPPFFVEALRAREDMRFFDHHGVDTRGLARATLRNLRDLSFTQGASTLTMQLARNTFEMRERNLHRKLLEIALTLRIEAMYSKDEILSCYLNRIYFGSGCHGIEEAARTYFDVPASDLNRNQCALLAGIIRAPHACSPLRNIEGAHRQRDEVLQRMVAEEMLTAADSENILAEPLALHSPNPVGGHAAPLVQRHFEELLDDTDLTRGGLVLHSTIDASIQTALEEGLLNFTDRLSPAIEVAAVILDPRSGGIEAAVGGRQPRPGRYHRVLDARRDLGPVFTPFVLVAAAERGMHPGPDPVTTGQRLGNAEMERLAKRFGFTGPFRDGPDLYRGALSVTPLELATATAVLAARGNRPRTHLVDRLLSPDDTILFQGQASSTPAFSPGAVQEGLEVQFPDRQPRLLTGLSPARTDAWGIFFNQRHVTCIWVGHDQPEPLSDPRLLPALEALLQRLQDRLPAPR